MDFVRTVSERLQCGSSSPRKSDLLNAIYAKLYEDYKAGITPVLIIDEAHLIPYRETFEEIRLLTNFQMDDDNLLALVLVGQPDLMKKLQLPSLAALRQRVGLFCRLETLGEDEIKAYVEHRIAVGGRAEPVFTDAAIRALYKYSEGIPRVINSLAGMALLEGFARDATLVDESVVRSAAKEIGLNGYRKDKEEI